jgi:hypothetical protein
MQVQVTDGEEPGGAPQASHEGVLFDPNLLRVFCAGF